MVRVSKDLEFLSFRVPRVMGSSKGFQCERDLLICDSEDYLGSKVEWAG